MTGRRAIVGLCMLCALLVSAFAAQSASAVTKGTTAFTCKEGPGDAGGQTFVTEHCKASDGASGPFGHYKITQDETTEIKGTCEKTDKETKLCEPSILKVTIAGTPLELRASGVEGTGTMHNVLEGGEHVATGTGTLIYTGVEVVKPAGKGCNVFEDNAEVEGNPGTVKTNSLKATTAGQGDFLKFEPDEGSIFATFFVTCTGSVPAELTGTWTVNGSLKCPTEGATVVCKHEEITTQNTLKAKGAKAGLEGKLTIKGKKSTDSVYTPLSVTTVETP